MFNHTTRELGSHLLVRNPKLLSVKTPLAVRLPGRWVLADVVIVVEILYPKPCVSWWVEEALLDQ